MVSVRTVLYCITKSLGMTEMSPQVNGEIAVHPHNGILCTTEKRTNDTATQNMGEFHTVFPSEMNQTERVQMVGFCLQMTPESANSF